MIQYTHSLPFEVVRRRGEYFVRATGLADVLPRFTRTKTGDYFNTDACGYINQSCAAIAFGRFLDKRLRAGGRLVRHSDKYQALVHWSYDVTRTWRYNHRQPCPFPAL